MPSIEIRDERNPDRLLGFLSERPVASLPENSGLTLAVRPPLRHGYTFEEQRKPFDIHRIHFRRHVLLSKDGYTATVVLTTDAPLGVLMWMDLFVLPGETGSQAHYRRQYA